MHVLSIDRNKSLLQISGKVAGCVVRTLKTFQGTHILGASRGLLCDSSAVLSYLVQAAKTLLYQVFIRSTSVLQHIRVADTVCDIYSLVGCVKERHGSRHEIIKSNQKPNSVNRCMEILRNNPAKICIHPVWKDSALGFLADRTATQYDPLLASSCRPSVGLSVCLCRCALWLSGLVYMAKSCTNVFLAGMFLYLTL